MKQKVKMKTSGTKKRNPQDLTLRNLRSLKKRIDALELAVAELRGLFKGSITTYVWPASQEKRG